MKTILSNRYKSFFEVEFDSDEVCNFNVTEKNFATAKKIVNFLEENTHIKKINFTNNNL